MSEHPETAHGPTPASESAPGRAPSSGHVALRLLMAAVALAAGIVAVVVAIQLIRTVL